MRLMRTRRVAALLVASVTASACSTVISGTPQASDAPRKAETSSGKAVGVVPPGLEQFYGQQITWGPCYRYATTTTPADARAYNNTALDCARVQVPLDYADPAGTAISLAMLRLRTSGARSGSLLVNPGGPGASGMSLVANLADTVAATPLGQSFDLVGFDPRGVGASEPAVACLDGKQTDAERADLDLDTSPAGIAQTETEEKDYAATCSSRVGNALLEHVGTREAAQDMDVLRSVLGDEKLTYLGYSYGTRLGTAYAEKFPRNVRALVLDGALDPAADPVQELVRQGQGFQGAFDAYAKNCAARSTCPLGKDPAAASAAFQTLVRQLITKPAKTDDPRGLGYNDAVTGTIQALYSPTLWDTLTLGFAELVAGRGNKLLALADLYNGRIPDGRYTNQNDAFTAVRCVDSPPVTDRTVVNQADTSYRKVAPFLDDGLGSGNAPLDACAFWPVPPTGAPHTPSAPGLAPTVVISTTGDPATPYQAGVDLAAQLGARLITYRGNQHTVALSGVGCVDDAVTAYLVNLTVPSTGLTC